MMSQPRSPNRNGRGGDDGPAVIGADAGRRSRHGDRSFETHAVPLTALVPALNVAENLFLNRERVAGPSVIKAFGWLRKRQMYAESRQILSELNVTLPSVRATVDRLSGGQRQAIAVGRAAAWGSHIVIMDEPSAALGVEQARNMRELIGRLASRGIAVMLITHNMQEALEVCDHAIVLRHGRKVGDVNTAAVTARDLVDMITGAGLRPDLEEAEL
jgi:ABC-type sugar transport system ATPase subunit